VKVWDWTAHAACRGLDINLFFGTDGERYDQGARQRREAEARAVCASCPVAAECLAHALEHPEKYGTWGQMTEEELKAERRRRTRRSLAAQKRDARRRERVAS
jgi:WhiB family redox-sensing transcriptional regulator